MSLGAIVAMKAVAEDKIKPEAIIADAPFANLHAHLRARSRVLGFPGEPFGTLVTMWIGIEKGFNGFNHDANNYAKKIRCPTMIECGERDRYVSVDEIKTLFKNISATNTKLVLYPEADHESYLHVDPNRWEKEVRDFLDHLPR
jgi:alpha-beta hydrolase superfamily lysophospholipase